MKLRNKLKNTVLATLAGLTLTACGGGGGGGSGAVDDIKDWVNDDLTNLSIASSNVSDWAGIITDLEIATSSASSSSISALLTGPTAEDKASAQELLSLLTRANEAWNDSHNNINNHLNDAQKFEKFNDDDYKKAYQAIQFLNNNVKPLLQKVASGQAITLTEFNSLDKKSEANKLIDSYDAESHVAQKLIKSSTSKNDGGKEVYNEIEDGDEKMEISGDGTKDWAPIQGAGGKEERTVAVFTGQTKIRKVQTCSWTEVVKLTATGSSTFKENETCGIETFTTTLPDKKELVKQERAGTNPIQDDLTVITWIAGTVDKGTKGTEFNSAYGTDGVHTDPQEKHRESKTETTPGSESTDETLRSVVRFETTGTKNQVWKITDQYKKTTVTKPAVKTTYDVVTYKDIKTKQKRTWTIKTESKLVTYKDGTTETLLTQQPKENTSWETVQVSDESRTERENETSENIFLTPDIKDEFDKQLSKVLKNNAYTDEDVDLGTKTANMSTTVADHETAEYKSNHGLNTINAADAYARGWTGKGAVLGVLDTWQDTDHENLDGKYLYYKDYEPNNGTVIERQWHGTHVASIMAGEKTGDTFDEHGRLTTGDYSSTQKWVNGNPVKEYTLVKNNNTHGVAFDAKLVGANIDRASNGRISANLAKNALHDFAKLKSAESEGGEGMNIVAVNMSFNNDAFFGDNVDHDNDSSTRRVWQSSVTQLSDGTYKASEIVEMLNGGQGHSSYYQAATDSDIILVNSAGNTGHAHAGDPGIWAVEEDSNGNLILGGRMVVVGNWNGTEVEGNKAGHVCMKINTSNNTCNDTHRISDFYILAPGDNIMAATPNGSYAGDGKSGTSMAAPHVTGAFGVLNQMWPYMAGDNLVKLVMNTADKTMFGTDYDVNIHGQGMLDLNEATKPQGALGVPTSGRVDNPTTIHIKDSYISTGTFFPSSLSNLKIMVLDDYNRNYYIDIGSSFVVQDKRKYSDVDMLVDNKDTFLPHQQMYGSFAQGGQYDLAKNYNFGFYTGENGSGDYSLNVGKDFYVNNKFKLKTSLGHMSEQETWLGNSSDGAFAVGDNNDTTSANIGVAYQLGNNVLTLDYSKGFTDVNTTDNSLIKSFSDIETESYRLAYEIHKDTHTTFGWSFSLPSHITSGTMDLEVAESVNLDGTINYTDINSNLTQGTKEKNIGFYYNKSGADDLDASVNFTAEYRMDKSGVANNDGVEVGMNFVKKFAGSCKFLWMKNPKCFDKDGKMKSDLFSKNVDNSTKHGLVYDLKTDKFIPIKK